MPLSASPGLQSFIHIAWSTIETFAADQKFLGGKTGMICILHTWGRTQSLHPHLHCIIPAGGISSNHRWRFTRNDGKFLFLVKALSRVFRARYVAALRSALPDESKHSLTVYSTPIGWCMQSDHLAARYR